MIRLSQLYCRENTVFYVFLLRLWLHSHFTVYRLSGSLVEKIDFIPLVKREL